eukprot:1001421-Amorphochlora_amoeboformis.AAC.2
MGRGDVRLGPVCRDPLPSRFYTLHDADTRAIRFTRMLGSWSALGAPFPSQARPCAPPDQPGQGFYGYFSDEIDVRPIVT